MSEWKYVCTGTAPGEGWNGGSLSDDGRGDLVTKCPHGRGKGTEEGNVGLL